MSYRPSSHRPSREQNPPRIPEPKAQCYFEADGKTLRAALVDGEAEQFAQKISEVPPTRLRRFYEDVLSLRSRLEAQTCNGERTRVFQGLLPEFKMLKAKAAYTSGRLGRRERESFAPLLGFFVNHTHSVKSVEEFDAFYKHFQAIVAFHKFYGKEKG
jgi:CRISPR-associated protein Csm2